MVTFGDAPGFAGTLRDVDLEQLPQERIGAPLRLKGRADADLDITMRETGPEGDVEFEARDGLLTHPNLPLPMPFQKLTGEVELGGANWAEIRKFELASPLAIGPRDRHGRPRTRVRHRAAAPRDRAHRERRGAGLAARRRASRSATTASST